MWKHIWWFFSAFLALSDAGRSVLFEPLLKQAELQYKTAGELLTPEELEKRVTESLQRASELLNLDLPTVDGDCEIDFSAFCPEGWVPSGDGVHCQVLPWRMKTAGMCGEKLEMLNKSPLDKLNLMRTCDIKWPCLETNVNVPESDQLCPQHWVRKGDECIAGLTYNGPCEGRIQLLGKSRQERQELARKCHLKFPLHPELQNVDSSWNAPCPLGWLKQDEGICTLGKDQSPGKCGKTLKLGGLSDRHEKTKLCGLVWPPRTDDVVSHCPFGWKTDEETGFCLAPSSYKGPCQLRVDFTHYSMEDKAIWAHVCGVSFLDSGVPDPPKRPEDVSYRNGALDRNLSVVRFGKPVADVNVMERQLTELTKLRKTSTDRLFLSTLEKSIAQLKERIKNANSGNQHSFLQLDSMVLTPERNRCPYGWRQFYNICVANETYRLVVPSCKTIRNVSEEIEDRCRVAVRTENPNEDFVRPYCPVGWKTRQVYFHNLIRHLCVAPIDFKESRKQECGGTPIDFSARSPGFKRRWAYSCGQRFPEYDDKTVPKCVENFFWKCPAEWSLNGNECVAPQHYEGPCADFVSVEQLSTEIAKAEFSRRCHAPWTCLGHCAKNYEQDCPEGWVREGDACLLQAPAETTHCGRNIAILRNWTRYHKEELEFLCDVHWPCKKVQA